jgi:N6-L-threonylcarbamoyladenine synthase
LGYDFSYSGLKTAVINHINSERMKGGLTQKQVCDIAASFQKAALDMLLRHIEDALNEYKLNTLALAGGVAANSLLRARLQRLSSEKGIKLYIPPLSLCGDNAAMIGAAAWFKYYERKEAAFSLLSLNTNPSLKIDEDV